MYTHNTPTFCRLPIDAERVPLSWLPASWLNEEDTGSVWSEGVEYGLWCAHR